ncbi:MAG: hypothetical protein ACI4F7_09470 [Acutalibacteraceae bacterium]
MIDGLCNKPCRAWQIDRLYSPVKKMQPECHRLISDLGSAYVPRG